MTPMVWWLIGLAAVLAVIDWIAVVRQSRPIELFAKPATMLALVAAAIAAHPGQDGVHLWLVLGLVFGLCGDVALVAERRFDNGDLPAEGGRLFVLGLASFLIGHVCYAVAMLRHGTDELGITFGLILALIVILAFGFQVILGAHREGGLALAAAVTLYVAALGTMLVLGIGTSSLWIAYGAMLFAASDLALGTDRFISAKFWARITVIVTYHVAQLLLLIGLVR
jgi:uncharacterized membrane protein YhhN